MSTFLLGRQALAFCAGVGALLFYASEKARFDVVTEHHIEVLKRVGQNEWLMHSDEQGDFLYTGCDDFPNDSVIWEGYLANRARWEERGACKSIRRQDLGFWWERDERGDARRIPLNADKYVSAATSGR
jgi:hypothetical protein